MKNILLISFAFLFVGACSNPVADDGGDSTTCSATGCTATECASDCICGCNGVSGANGCTCATNCACGGDGNSSTGTESGSGNTITVVSFAFDPSSLTISAGETVTWTDGSTYHTVFSNDGLWAVSHALTSIDSFEYTFNDVGTFTYKCGNHSSMTGTIIVE